MIQRSYLIADSTKYGKDQVISGTIRYPWEGCKVADELEKSNKWVISEALGFAKANGYDNIREVKVTFKEVFIPKWRMVDLKKVRERIVKFDTNNF